MGLSFDVYEDVGDVIFVEGDRIFVLELEKDGKKF